MLYIRSKLFFVVSLLLTVIELILFSPFFFFLSPKKAWAIPKLWVRQMNFLLRHITGLHYEIEGLENLPKDGAFILAPKHQTAWDSYSFLPLMPEPVMILKKSLLKVPLFGSYMRKVGVIGIDRGKPVQAMRQVMTDASQALSQGRQLLLFPEGTRRAVGAEPAYKAGIVALYSEMKVPVVIVAHNAGLYSGKASDIFYPGTIKCRVLPPIQPGLPKEEFLQRLITETENACTDLLIQDALSENPPAMTASAIKKLAEHGINWQGPVRP